jgi:hypothetical protein
MRALLKSTDIKIQNHFLNQTTTLKTLKSVEVVKFSNEQLL